MKHTLYCLRNKKTNAFAWRTMALTSDMAWKEKEAYENNGGYLSVTPNSDYECVQLEIEERNIVGD